MRPRSNPEDREFEKEVEASLKVTSYLDDVYNAIATGQKVKPQVPNYGSGVHQGNLSNESGSLFSLDADMMLKTALSVAPEYAAGLPRESDSPTQRETVVNNAPKHKISARQWSALQKYPSLIEMLGTDDGEKIVQEIIAKVNQMLSVKIQENTQAVTKTARVCVAEKQYLKQYFAGDDNEWVCKVIASGPFRGDEAFYYNVDKDKAAILRKVGEDYQNVSDEFNIVHEFVNAQDGVKND